MFQSYDNHARQYGIFQVKSKMGYLLVTQAITYFDNRSMLQIKMKVKAFESYCNTNFLPNSVRESFFSSYYQWPFCSFPFEHHW